MAQFSNQANGIDTHGASVAADTNYSTNTSIYVGHHSGTNTWRSLLKWDLTSIPSNATITDATITLIISDQSDHANTRTLRAYRVKRTWVVGEATWNSYATGSAWGTAMCANTTSDRESTDVGNVSVANTVNIGDTINISLTAASVQEMINGTFTNNGWLLKFDTENEDLVLFSSTNNATNKPKLVINYTLPSGGGMMNFFFK